MQRFTTHKSLILVFVCAGICFTGTALADKPNRDAGKKNENQRQYDHNADNASGQGKAYGNSGSTDSGDGMGHGARRSEYFSQQKQRFIHGYYSEKFRKGHCPSGLAKKHNGCMAPGHAKRWERGQPLPREVIFYTLPPAILIQLGPAPPRHRYVRVAQDILLIAMGTDMVVDAIEDIGRRLD